MSIVNKHAPLKKMLIRANNANNSKIYYDKVQIEKQI